MKKSTTEVVKVLLASVAGTGMVIFGMWFMSGGVMLLPPWIVIPVFVLLFFVSVIVVGRKIHYKYILSVMASFVFGWFGFGALYKHTCGPNSADVKVMKPMAEAISSYIIKHGVPKSLRDIPGLPYRLEECEREEEYLKLENGDMQPSDFTKADLYNFKEKCHFANIQLQFWMQKEPKEKHHTTVSLKMVSSGRTFFEAGLAMNKNGKFIKLDNLIGSYKNTGICNPMKQ